MRRLIVVLAAVGALIWRSGGVSAEVTWVTLETDRGERLKTLLGRPETATRPVPAVVYSHGSGVRLDGYDESGNKADVKGFVEALVALGYVALAPIREFERHSATIQRGRPVGSGESWDAVIDGGLRTVAAARRFLEQQTYVDAKAMALVGFSEGGNVSLWAMIRQPGFRAAALLAPAVISPAPTFNLGKASSVDELRKISAPLFIALTVNDEPPIARVVTQLLIPNLGKAGRDFRHNIGYAGEHRTFWRVQPEYWKDVAAFLAHHLQ
jgi:dienelactone hydrolase